MGRLTDLEKQLLKALKGAERHLDWISYGDPYERDCAHKDGLQDEINAAIEAARKIKEK